ncbi:ABC transporter permease subunit [Anaerocolumna sedimenticola]|uniref:ABC transporter permease subunit n=1 Tax=Anaerocolumna sedimenticola TaxID=2696063 RepID=A0A6P1TJY1_9FIRM|nr:sugar ABC transporter permease [Anaerocolumna sedimenticola]QHQ59945.1 ABC transporter permease subunit [Anaerocolumna sedimenticola]
MRMKMATKKKLEGFCFILPGFLYMLLILGYPLIYNFILSFKNMDIKNFKKATSVFIGFQNYSFLFKDETFRLVFRNTFIFTISCLIFQFTIGFIFAMFFSKKFTFAGPIRGLILIAYMMPMSVTALMGKNIFGVSEGVINDLLMKIGIIKSPVEWLVSTSTALIAVIVMNCWVGIPFNMLLLTSGLTGIPDEIYDSAAVDGANPRQRFLHIILPLMRPAILSVLMLGFIYTFKAFDLMFVMTSGGPLNSTDVLGTYAYNLSFTQYKFSLGAASAIILFICLFAVGLFYLRLISKEED